MRSCSAGFLRNDLRRLGSHHRSLRIRTIRSSLRARQIFRQFFGYAAAVLQLVATFIERLAKCAGWSSVELREFRAQPKICGPAILSLTAFAAKSFSQK